MEQQSMSLNLDDLQLGSPTTPTSPATTRTGSSSPTSRSQRRLDTLRETGEVSLSLSCWQESAMEEQRQRSSRLGDDDDDYVGSRSSRGGGDGGGGSALQEARGIGGTALTKFPSLGSVLEDFDDFLIDDDDDDDNEVDGDDGKPSWTSSSNTPQTPHNSTSAGCRFSSSSSSTAHTSSTSSLFSGSNAHLGSRHVHFEVPARLEQIQEFEKPDLEDYHLLYYMAHEIQKMIDDERREEQHHRTIIR
jgi:hypothetical protein